MKKYVLMIEDNNPSYAYNKNIILSTQEEGVYCVNQFSGWKLKLFYALFSWKLNKRIEIPLKRFIFKSLLKDKGLDKKDDIWFIFFESYLPAYSNKYLQYLKKKYVNAKLCLVLNNPLTSHVLKKVNYIKRQYDKIATFLKEDADKYGMAYYPYGYPFYIEDDKDKKEEKSDVFFVGTDKGRLPYLINLFEKFSENGLKSDFIITGTTEENQKYKDEILYNCRIPYEEVIERVKASRCILEILQENANYCSLRYLEALLCRKKLITTNKRVKELPEYDERYIYLVDDICDISNINIDFIKKDVDEGIFPNKDFCSFKAFEDFLEDKIRW